MRKSLILLAVLLVLSVAVLAAGQGMVGAMGDDVTISETTVAGDPAAAEGWTVDLHLLYENHLEWHTSFAVGADPEPETDCRYSAKERTDSRSGSQSVYMQIGSLDYVMSASGGEVALTDDSDSTGFQAMLRPAADVATRTRPGETRTETVYLRDYYEIYTVSLDGPFYLEQGTADLSDYFRIPVPEDLRVEVTVSKDEVGGVYSVGCTRVEGAPYSYGYGLSTERGVLLGLFAEDDSEAGRTWMDYSQIKGGYGVYWIPLEQGSLATDRIENIYPMDQTTEQYVSLAESAGGTQLLLFTRERGQLVLTVLDRETLEPVQRLELPTAEAPTIWQAENLLVLQVYEEGLRLLVLPRENGSYRLWLDTPQYQFEDVWYSEPAVAFDGDRLAMACFEQQYHTASLCLTVYDQTGLTYAGRYDHNADLFDPKLSTYWSDAITLQWK